MSLFAKYKFKNIPIKILRSKKIFFKKIIVFINIGTPFADYIGRKESLTQKNKKKGLYYAYNIGTGTERKEPYCW